MRPAFDKVFQVYKDQEDALIREHGGEYIIIYLENNEPVMEIRPTLKEVVDIAEEHDCEPEETLIRRIEKDPEYHII